MSAFGGAVRSSATSGTRNGRTLPTHGAGSGANSGGVGRYSPGALPTGGMNGPKRPSFARAASMVAAADSPSAMPRAFAGPSGTVASDPS